MKKPKALQALAHGLLDGGAEIVTNFPGFMSHELFSLLGGKITSINERVAYEIAWGASYAGKRSAATFKNVGLNNAADPFLNSLLTGVNTGMVTVVFDDVQVEGSQSRQDSRHYFDFFGGLWLEPYSVESAYHLTYKGFDWSERFGLPVVIRITNQLLQLKGKYQRLPKQNRNVGIRRNKRQFVVHPTNYKYQRKQLEEKKRKILKFVETLYKEQRTNQNEKSRYKSIISFGCCPLEEVAYLDNTTEKFQVFTYPIPQLALKKFLKRASKIQILEQGDPYGYRKIRELATNLSNISSECGFVPDNSENYIISDNYKKLFKAIKSLDPQIVVGDLGEYTKDTLNTIEACLCLGSSISIGLGASLGEASPVFVVIGDGAFLHSGKDVIPEVLKRKADLNVIVICNGGAKVTGGQEIPGELLHQPKGVNTYMANYCDTSEKKFVEMLNKMSNDKKVSVLYLSTK